MKSRSVDGVLVVDKPMGPTSSDVVVRVRRLLRGEKVGHTGTLDPLATGVLPLCLGRATRLVQFLALDDKEYRATARLGIRTDTGDSEGRTLEERPVPELSPQAIEQALATLRGDQLQRPPMYSAVKVGGERLYEIARRGGEVERAARPIRVDRFDLASADGATLVLDVRCSKGTYVRTLVEDLGERLGCGAHLTALRRLRSGQFGLRGAVTLDELERAPDREALAREQAVPLEGALAGLPSVRLGEREAAGVRHGRLPRLEAQGRVALLGPAGELLAIAETEGEKPRLACVLAPAR